MKKEIPFVAFGNYELSKKSSVGKIVKCPKCGKNHKVRYGEDFTGDKAIKL